MRTFCIRDASSDEVAIAYCNTKLWMCQLWKINRIADDMYAARGNHVTATSYEARWMKMKPVCVRRTFHEARTTRELRVVPGDYRYGDVTRTYRDSVVDSQTSRRGWTLSGHPHSEDMGENMWVTTFWHECSLTIFRRVIDRFRRDFKGRECWSTKKLCTSL